MTVCRMGYFARREPVWERRGWRVKVMEIVPPGDVEYCPRSSVMTQGLRGYVSPEVVSPLEIVLIPDTSAS